MSNIAELRGSFMSLIASLKDSSNIFAPADARSAYQSAFNVAVGIAQNQAWWRSAPDTAESYPGLITDLDASSRKVSGATDDPGLIAAYQQSRTALTRLKKLQG